MIERARRARLHLGALALLLPMLLATLVGGIVHAAPPSQEPGPVVDRVFFKAFDVDRAPLDLRQGNMDLYLFGLKLQAARALRGTPGIRIYEAPATNLSIILNPAPGRSGELNPFSIKKVRQAVQYLVNREFVVGDIYRGMALPMVTHLSPADFDQLTVYDQVRQSDIRYDPQFARSMIKGAMEEAGGSKAAAARALGINRSTLYYRLRKHKLSERYGLPAESSS